MKERVGDEKLIIISVAVRGINDHIRFVGDRQTDHATCVETGRIFTLCIAMSPKNYSERQNWRHQFRGQHDDETMKYRQHMVKLY